MSGRPDAWWIAELERSTTDLARRVRSAGLNHMAEDVVAATKASVARRLGEASATSTYPEAWFGVAPPPNETSAAFHAYLRAILRARINDELRVQYRTTRRQSPEGEYLVRGTSEREVFLRKVLRLLQEETDRLSEEERTLLERGSQPFEEQLSAMDTATRSKLYRLRRRLREQVAAKLGLTPRELLED